MLLTIILWLLFVGLAVFAVYSRYIEPCRLEANRVRVGAGHLPPSIEGLKIAHLADTHLRQRKYPQEMARRAVELVLEEAPDIVCITGDICHGSRHVDLAVRALAPLAARMPVIAVMGNHDHDKLMENDLYGPPVCMVGAGVWRQKLEEAGICVLQNEHTIVEAGGRKIAVVGVGDPCCGWDDIEQALDGVPSGDLRLMLVHSPDMLDDPRTDWADLVLCGHTHGGQMQLPGVGSPWAPVWRDRRRASGLLAIGETLGFVTRGVAGGVKARFCCSPEVAMLTLTAGSGDAPRILPRYPEKVITIGEATKQAEMS